MGHVTIEGAPGGAYGAPSGRSMVVPRSNRVESYDLSRAAALTQVKRANGLGSQRR